MSKTYNLVCPETKKAIWCGQGDRIYGDGENLKRLAEWLHAHKNKPIHFVGDESELLDDIEFKDWVGMEEQPAQIQPLAEKSNMNETPKPLPPPEPYDSTADTLNHINRVRYLLREIEARLYARGLQHDASKLSPEEKPYFDKVTPKLKGLTYGSPEYRASLKELGPALQHHYKSNTHHPEHFQKQVCIICFTEYAADHTNNCLMCNNGTFSKESNIAGMDLLDLIEMLCDWKAAGERHTDGSLTKSLEVNRDRFHIGPQLHSVLDNTVRNLGWGDAPPGGKP